MLTVPNVGCLFLLNNKSSFFLFKRYLEKGGWGQFGDGEGKGWTALAEIRREAAPRSTADSHRNATQG